VQEAQAQQRGSRPALAAVALSLVAVPLPVLLLLVRLRWGPLRALDEGVLDGLHAWALAAPRLVLSMQVVTTLGTGGAYAVLLSGLVLVLLRRGQRRLALFAVVTTVGGQLLNVAAKASVDRARPLLDDPVATAASSSFPSGHAQGVVVFTGVLLLVLPRAARPAPLLAALTWSLLMGATRLVLGVHYLSDVVAGFLLGLAWLAACAAAFDVPGTTARPARGGPRARP
jgi:membrane-associated phospholipid phosphatase